MTLIKDTISGTALDECAAKYGFSHQTAFNMRHKMLIALQNMLEDEPTVLSGTVEFDETFVLDCYKGKNLSRSAASPHANMVYSFARLLRKLLF